MDKPSNPKPKINFSYSSSNQQVPPQQQAQMQQPQQMQQLPQINLQETVYPNEPPIQICGYTGPMEPQICGPFGIGPEEDITILNNKEEDKGKKVVAMIVTFVNGCTYDSLFTSVEQKSPEGTRVLVYSCSSQFMPKVMEGIKNPETIEKQELKSLVENLKELDPDCAVFNWECSSGYGGKTFTEGKKQLFEFVRMLVDRGHMVMFSDFSLKALINEWSSEHLGPNPFKQVGETSNPIDIAFKNEDLRDCPSAQLQIVGEMAEKGIVHVEVMGGTIVYTVKNSIPQTDLYKLKILTVVPNAGHISPQHQWQIGDVRGTAGHVLLTFKSGGHLLTSMGHWVELMRVDTSEHKLFEMAERQYGASAAAQMRMEYESMGEEAQRNYISKQAVNIVQNQAPCYNMSMKQASYKGKY